MKMNWGKALFLVMTAFMLFILGMCYFFYTAPLDAYDHQYYEKGLAFDHDYNREVQVYKDHAVPVIKSDNENLVVTFSKPVNSGKITMSRPNNSAMDRVFVVNNTAMNKFFIRLKNIAKGEWQLVFDWQAGKKTYLYQKEVYLK
jgi:hypothetical protein